MIFELLVIVHLLATSCSASGITFKEYCQDQQVECQCGQQSGNTFHFDAPQCAFIYSWEPYCHLCEDGERISKEQVCSKFLNCEECEYGSDACSKCPPGRYGNLCEFQCQCQNGGQCHSSSSKCTCPPGFYGALCEARAGCTVPPVAFPVTVALVSEGDPSRLKFSCSLEGYVLEGHPQVSCRVYTGEWDHPPPICVPSCGTPVAPENGQLVSALSGTIKYGHYVDFRCREGFQLVGSARSTCLGDGTWSHRAPTCQEITCEDLQPGAQSQFLISTPPHQAGFTKGTKITVSCSKGYELQGQSVLECGEDGQWSSNVPACRSVVRNISCETSGVQVLGEEVVPVRVTCPPGCSRSNSSIWGTVVYAYTSSVCKAAVHAGKVSDAKGGDLSLLSNGPYNHFLASTMNSVTSEGKRLVAKSFRFHHDLILEKLLLKDTVNVTCDDPGELTNGTATLLHPARGFVRGSTVLYSCHPRHVLRGRNSSVCGQDGTWSSPKPKCQRISACLDPSPVLYGSFKVLPEPVRVAFRSLPSNSTGPVSRASRVGRFGPVGKRNKREAVEDYPKGHHRRGTRVQFQCASRFYKLRGSSTRNCLADGTWSGRRANCVPVCGRSDYSRTPFVFKGNSSTAGQWPWHVGLRKYSEKKPVCGGAVVNEYWIVTAAHCLFDEARSILNAQDITVFAGKLGWDDSNEQGFAQFRKAAELYIHPDYSPSTYNADIGLVRLTNPLVLSPMVQPICMPTDDDLAVGKQGVVTGWGQTDKADYSRFLLHGVLPVVSPKECTETYMGWSLSDTMFCAGSDFDKTASRPGDSGGPLVFQEESIEGRYWVLEGIVSWGDPPNYGVFTNVKRALDWITQYV